MAKSAQDRRVYTPSTSGAVCDRRPGHSSYRTVGGVDRPDHPGTTGRRGGGPGRHPDVTDAELICLAVAHVLLRYNDEHHWLRAAPSRVGHLFPRLLSQPAYNHRLRASAELMEAARRWLAGHTPATSELLRLLDGTRWWVAARGRPPPARPGRLGRLWPRHLAPLLLLGQPAAAGHHPRRDRDGVRVGQPQPGRRTRGRRGHAGWVPANRPAPGTLLVGDKGFAGRAFQTALAGLELGILGPARSDEPDPGVFPNWLRQRSRRSSGPQAPARPGPARRWHPGRAVGARRAAPARSQHRDLVQLADRRPDQALPDRLRPLPPPPPAPKTASTI
jgi:hypothetical protein